MGKRDYSWKEPKKPKKGAKKTKIASELMPPTEVEVVRKKRKPSAEE
ncbi:unnamed protein product [marine sediment metagenome]|uniref:Uncharacterized protein n=1 Tax=marine sediment metagenome TaxID=412755 RepID=X1Q3N1_9ZZZZ